MISSRKERQRGTIELLIVATLLLAFLMVSRVSKRLMASSQLSSQLIHSVQRQENERGQAIQQLPHLPAPISYDQILCIPGNQQHSESLCSFIRADPKQYPLLNIESHFHSLNDCPFDTSTVLPEIRRRSVQLCMKRALPATTSARYRGDMYHDKLVLGTAKETTELIITGSLFIRELNIAGNVLIASLGDIAIQTIKATEPNTLAVTLLNPSGKLTVHHVSPTVIARYYARSIGSENHQLQRLTPNQNPWPLSSLVIGMVPKDS